MESLYDNAEQRRFSGLEVGYDWKGKIFEKTLSPEVYFVPKTRGILLEIEKTFEHLINTIKHVKSYRSFAIPKNYKKFN